MPRTFHPNQIAYLAARAAYEGAIADKRAHMAQYDALSREGATDAELDQWVALDDAADVVHGVNAAYDALRAAENALIEWAIDVGLSVARTSTDLQALGDLRAALRDNAPRVYKHRARMIDLAMRYDAKGRA